MAASYKLAVIITNPVNDDELLLVKQAPPPKFDDEEYDSYVDSHLWDLPSAQLLLHQGGQSNSVVFIQDQDLCSHKIDFTTLDFAPALNQVLAEVGFGETSGTQWKFSKFVEEPDFGPGNPIHTVYITGQLGPEDGVLKEHCKWMSDQSYRKCLLDLKPSNVRIGPLAVLGPLENSLHSDKWTIPPNLHSQEYPPGIIIIPMGSRTGKPFRTTNLVVFASESSHDNCGDHGFIAHGDALIIDPGCRSEFHKELRDVVAALPKKLVVFVTHHHNDHVDGLSAVQKSNPDASLLAHDSTMRRIRKDGLSLSYTPVSGAEEICIGGQRLRVISAPGHTDGHMALLHLSTHSLIVGDHCVGQGSAVLDISSGGNMNDYFQTTYRFMEVSPCTLIPMHGRINLWPKHLLCEYLKNRRNRESSVLKSIEDGAETLFDIVANVYSNVDRSFWFLAASNVRLHVDHLAHQNKLPKEFPLQKYQRTCGVHFLSRWLLACARSRVARKYNMLGKAKLPCTVALLTVGLAVIYSVRSKA
ncbi:uncharacterized protein LOC141702041 [Apium graveolens]|uniref:Metallo-beta-lactamase domain-containing protein n=1 Tax=Apium graveolens TaxID=4045 RepID=A0A6L5B9Q0_APIGR|nr:hypothetical protein AG4045_021939 [Apium graveolens]